MLTMLVIVLTMFFLKFGHLIFLFYAQMHQEMHTADNRLADSGKFSSDDNIPYRTRDASKWHKDHIGMSLLFLLLPYYLLVSTQAKLSSTLTLILSSFDCVILYVKRCRFLCWIWFSLSPGILPCQKNSWSKLWVYRWILSGTRFGYGQISIDIAAHSLIIYTTCNSSMKKIFL